MLETSETSFPRVAPELTMNLTNGPENQFNMQPFSDSDRSDSQLDMPLHSVFGVCIVHWEIFGKPSAYSREFS